MLVLALARVVRAVPAESWHFAVVPAGFAAVVPLGAAQESCCRSTRAAAEHQRGTADVIHNPSFSSTLP